MNKNKFGFCFLGLLFLSGAVSADQSIIFLSRQQASAAIVDDKGEPYFSTLQPMEMAAKTGRVLTVKGLRAQRQETRNRYRESVLDFSPGEKTAITSLVKGIDARLRGHYDRLANLPWKFLKVDDNIEGGLPHTRGDYIVLSRSMASELIQITRQYTPQDAVAVGAGILLHEHIHVLQRSNPKLFDSLYNNVWGYVRVDPIRENGWLLKHHLANPDGLDCCWLFPVDAGKTRFILPGVIFAEGEYLKHMPQDFRMVALEVRKSGDRFTFATDAGGRPVFQPLMSVEPYVRVFAISSNIYHPNEASADLVTQLVQYQLLSDKSRIPEANRKILDMSLAPVKRWADANL